MAEVFGFVVPRRGGQAEPLAHEAVVVGDGFQAIPVGVQAEAHAAQDEDLPQVHAGAAGGLFAGEDFGFEQGKDLGLERGVPPEPLQAGEAGGPFVAALEGQANLFDGRDVPFGLSLEMLAPGGECLAIGSSKWPERSNKVDTFERPTLRDPQCPRGHPAFYDRH